jgi:ABC-type uncharacterized transport system substrate-binding protein
LARVSPLWSSTSTTRKGNVTGVNIVTGDLTPERLQILTELVPARAIDVLMNPNYGAYHRDRGQIEEAGRQLGVKLTFATVSADADLDAAVASLVGQKALGLTVPQSLLARADEVTE